MPPVIRWALAGLFERGVQVEGTSGYISLSRGERAEPHAQLPFVLFAHAEAGTSFALARTIFPLSFRQPRVFNSVHPGKSQVKSANNDTTVAADPTHSLPPLHPTNHAQMGFPAAGRKTNWNQTLKIRLDIQRPPDNRLHSIFMPLCVPVL